MNIVTVICSITTANASIEAAIARTVLAIAII